MSQKPVVRQLLPVVTEDEDKLQKLWDYIYEPSAADLLDGTMQLARGLIAACLWLRRGRLAVGGGLHLIDEPVGNRVDCLTETGEIALWYRVEWLRLARLPCRELAQLALGNLVVGATRRGLQQERDNGRGLVPSLLVHGLSRAAGGS